MQPDEVALRGNNVLMTAPDLGGEYASTTWRHDIDAGIWRNEVLHSPGRLLAARRSAVDFEHVVSPMTPAVCSPTRAQGAFINDYRGASPSDSD